MEFDRLARTSDEVDPPFKVRGAPIKSTYACAFCGGAVTITREKGGTWRWRHDHVGNGPGRRKR